MLGNLLESNIAIIGGGKFCNTLLHFIYSENYSAKRPIIKGVADKDNNAPGMVYARSLGIFTTTDYTELFSIDGLEVILELTRDTSFIEPLKKAKPPHIRLIDHFEARYLWDSFQIENQKVQALRELEQNLSDPNAMIDIFNHVVDRMAAIIKNRNIRSREIEMELVEHERTQSQIIEGSTIPTFVINKDHIVTHWNKAVERLTGYSAKEIVGTRHQWKPFYQKERPTMADVILDQIDESEIKKLYGNWRRSLLLDEGYEAEGFFPRLGENGKWCWFTAAPIKAPDGTIIGAIETLWDKTEDKRAEEERERHTRELAGLCSMYSALNAPLDFHDRINAAIKEINTFLAADHICIFLLDENDTFHLKYHNGITTGICLEKPIVNGTSLLFQVAKKDELMILENLWNRTEDDIKLLKEIGINSLVYIPISAREEKVFGVIRIVSMIPNHFSKEQTRILELIGNRIGAAIENAMLQEQYIKSEEKYRSLFNNDPNPIFIIDSQTYRILDVNQRAYECYGYSFEEFKEFTFFQLGDSGDSSIQNGMKNLSQKQSILFSKKRHYKKGKIPFFVNINMSCARYGEKDVIIATTTDITESVEKETQLIQAGKMTTLGVMAAGMAHEINQPLNVIQICADYLLKMIKKGQPIKEEDLKTMAMDIISNVNRATKVIKHVRDFARQSDVVKTRVNINRPIQDVFKVLGHQIKAHQIEVELDLDPYLPYIMAEHNRLEQVFINLVSNAIDAIDEKTYMQKNGNFQKKLIIRSYTENKKVVVTVTDTGIGMTREVKNKLFEPFFTTKKPGKGTGLGISISYGIIKDYDGTIQVQSEFGKGSTFTVTFPVADQ